MRMAQSLRNQTRQHTPWSHFYPCIDPTALFLFFGNEREREREGRERRGEREEEEERGERRGERGERRGERGERREERGERGERRERRERRERGESGERRNNQKTSFAKRTMSFQRTVLVVCCLRS